MEFRRFRLCLVAAAGMLVAIGYFVIVYRMFRGKVRLEKGDHGY